MLVWLLWGVILTGSLLSAGHALLHKRDPRAALGWIVVCLILPGIGFGLYWLLGVNRIRTRARGWQAQGIGMQWLEPNTCQWAPEVARQLPFQGEHLSSLRSLSDAVTRRPLLQGNRIKPLHDGEEAYPAMLEAIAGAENFAYLSTYIFDTDETGRKFIGALSAAAERGVDVRVLVDALGEHYSFPSARRLLRKSKVRVCRFRPPSLSGQWLHLNLRNHRKLLVVDGVVGFAGGMNIGDRHLADGNNPRRVKDIHFKVEGPAVGQMQEAFLEDWFFVTKETFSEIRYPDMVEGGNAFCRGISAGPNEDFEKLSWIIIGALNSAQRRVRIMTPYFIPDRALISAINSAALREVDVSIILPSRNNLPYVAWASTAYLWELLQYRTRIFFQPPPFVHSKLLMVDEHFALIGSANLDPRSLRLNFEFNLEVYDGELLSDLARHFDEVQERSRPVTLVEVDARPLPVKLRDATVKLFSPYL